MPEKGLTELQAKQVHRWISEQMGGELAHNIYPGHRTGIWKINDEPIVMFREENPRYDEDNPEEHLASKQILLCSDKHAVELQRVGIVRFP